MRMIRFGLVLVGVTWGTACGALPDYAGPQPKPADSETATAVLAGGCFWGVDAVYKHVQGVSDVVSGYAGGNAATAHYLLVSMGDDRPRGVREDHL